MRSISAPGKTLRWGVAVLIAAAVATAVIVLATRTRTAPTPPPPAKSGLAPDPQAVRYRHPFVQSVEDHAAIGTLEERLRGPSPSPRTMTELAGAYLSRATLTADPKDYAAAEAMAQRSLELLPEPNTAVLVLAQVANTRHEFARAIELANRHQHGRSIGALTALATAHLARGELASASEDAEALLTAQTNSAAYLMRALVMQAQGRDAEAAFDFTRAALTEEPGDYQEAARLRSLWGRFLISRGELAGAGIVLDEALRVAPGFPLALAQRGELALRTGRAKEARALFEDAFARSRQVRYLIDQARAQELAGDRPGADALRGQVEHIVRGELTEGGLGHRLDLVEILVDRGSPADLTEATTLAREEVARRPSAPARFQLARALARSGNPNEALVQTQAALTSGVHEAQLYQLAAQLEQQRGNAARSALYERLANELDPGGSGWRRMGIGAR